MKAPDVQHCNSLQQRDGHLEGANTVQTRQQEGAVYTQLLQVRNMSGAPLEDVMGRLTVSRTGTCKARCTCCCVRTPASSQSEAAIGVLISFLCSAGCTLALAKWVQQNLVRVSCTRCSAAGLMSWPQLLMQAAMSLR